MAKQFDYYAGYPNQQRMPKWVGVAIGSIFGCLTLIALAVGIRTAMPARSAEASVLPPKPQAPAAIVATNDAAPVVDAEDATVQERVAKAHGKHQLRGAKGKKGHSIALMAKRPSKHDKKMKHAQMFAKSVAGGRRDKRARDDLDKILGL